MEIQILERDGWSIDCQYCEKKIIYTIIKNQQLPVPFFYAERTNDVLLRKQDGQRVENLYLSSDDGKPCLDTLEALWQSILENAPEAPNGGKFGLWTYVKCPHCRRELLYNNGVKNLDLRIFEPEIILVDEAILRGDSLMDSWKIKVNLTAQQT